MHEKTEIYQNLENQKSDFRFHITMQILFDKNLRDNDPISSSFFLIYIKLHNKLLPVTLNLLHVTITFIMCQEAQYISSSEIKLNSSFD